LTSGFPEEFGKERTGARYAREKQVLRCAQNDNQKSKNNDNSNDKSKAEADSLRE
jgi:hypothetical protein